MSLASRCGLWIGIIVLLGITPLNLVCPAQARDGFVSELVLSLARPAETSEQVVRWSEEIDRLISEPSWGPRHSGSTPAVAPRFPFRKDYFKASSSGHYRHFPGKQYLSPGLESLDRVQKTLTRMAARGEGAEMVDSGAALNAVGDATRWFSRIEIQVNKGTFIVKVVGITRKEENKVLYDCKAGLGSAEYPTPRGSFFIERIFDDHPLWIPPDRPWAWGESPSRNVYGGHMMPLYVKRPAAGSGGNESITDLDCVEGKMQMIDSGGYRVHGTNSPWSIGSGQSHGCVRLLNGDVKKIADLLKAYVGITVRDRSANGSFVKLAKPVRIILY